MSAFTDWTAQPQLVYPAAAAGTSITPNSGSFVNSNWAQIHSGFSRDILISGFAILTNEAGLWRIDLGTGTPGNEVVVGTWGDNVESTGTGSQFWEIDPSLKIASGSAISARIRKSGTGTTATEIKIMYYNLDPYGAIDFSATADFAVAGLLVNDGAIDFVATADFAVSGVIIPAIAHAPSFSARTLRLRVPRRF